MCKGIKISVIKFVHTFDFLKVIIDSIILLMATTWLW